MNQRNLAESHEAIQVQEDGSSSERENTVQAASGSEEDNDVNLGDRMMDGNQVEMLN